MNTQNTHINIKIKYETYTQLNILKGWLGAKRGRRIGLDEAIAQGIAEICRSHKSFEKDMAVALQAKNMAKIEEDEVEHA